MGVEAESGALAPFGMLRVGRPAGVGAGIPLFASAGYWLTEVPGSASAPIAGRLFCGAIEFSTAASSASRRDVADASRK